MERKVFLKKGLISGALLSTSLLPSSALPVKKDQNNVNRKESNPSKGKDEIIIEAPQSGEPHKGKVLLAIQAHSDDIPLFAGGTVAKLLDEGYTGYLLRTSDDSKGNYLGNYQDNINVAKKFGMVKAFSFDYVNHNMDAIQVQDLKGRLIFLIRLLKVDTIITWDPWEHYEENPDHFITARAVEAARWMAGGSYDYPEHFEAGLQPHTVKERYYFSRDPQRVNRIVDISKYIDKKVEVNMVNESQGPAGLGAGAKLRAKLAQEGRYLPILGNDDKTANFNYVKHFVFDIDSRRLNFTTESNKKIGEKYGLEWAEQFHYMSDYPHPGEENLLDKYIRENAIKK